MTGYNNIPPKIIKIAAPELGSTMNYLINAAIDTSCFPDNLKLANINPTHKKKAKTEKVNYRPLNILPSVSKIYEYTLNNQLQEYFKDIFSPHLSAFIQGYSCEDVLLHLIES